MSFRQQHNRKFWGWLLALALIVMALPSGASWQCLDGTPCPQNCPMLRSSKQPAVTHPQVTPAASECMRCHSAPVAILTASSVTQVACKTTICILRAQTQPAATLEGASVIILPLLALPPPHYAAPAVATLSAPIPHTPSLRFLPQRFLRPHAGRAPPFPLV